ncbi:hypothetical protein ACFSWD_17595 [Paenibacillus xanthanilyticus]
MKDTVTVTKAGGGDPWDGGSGGAPVTYKCRIDEGARLVRNQNGEEVVSSTQIRFDKLVAVAYDDEITFTDYAGKTHTKRPISVRIVKNIASKPLLTEVYV